MINDEVHIRIIGQMIVSHKNGKCFGTHRNHRSNKTCDKYFPEEIEDIEGLRTVNIILKEKIDDKD